MKLLMVLSEPPYNDRDVAWNALRLADTALSAGTELNLFLINDGVDVARERDDLAEGADNLAQMLADLIAKGATVKICKTCLDRCGIGRGELVQGTRVAGMADLHQWLLEADKVVSF